MTSRLRHTTADCLVHESQMFAFRFVWMFLDVNVLVFSVSRNVWDAGGALSDARPLQFALECLRCFARKFLLRFFIGFICFLFLFCNHYYPHGSVIRFECLDWFSENVAETSSIQIRK